MDKSLKLYVMKDMFISVISCNCFSLNGRIILYEELQSLPTHLGFCLVGKKNLHFVAPVCGFLSGHVLLN